MSAKVVRVDFETGHVLVMPLPTWLVIVGARVADDDKDAVLKLDVDEAHRIGTSTVTRVV